LNVTPDEVLNVEQIQIQEIPDAEINKDDKASEFSDDS
jgi:hypothetical protein